MRSYSRIVNDKFGIPERIRIPAPAAKKLGWQRGTLLICRFDATSSSLIISASGLGRPAVQTQKGSATLTLGCREQLSRFEPLYGPLEAEVGDNRFVVSPKLLSEADYYILRYRGKVANGYPLKLGEPNVKAREVRFCLPEVTINFYQEKARKLGKSLEVYLRDILVENSEVP